MWIKNETDIDTETYYLVNVGSVGQPRNHDPRASYAIYDTEEKVISLEKVSYDYKTTQKLVLEKELPAFLADRLAEGR